MVMGRNTIRGRRSIRTAPSAPCTGCPTARICASTTAPRSSAATGSPSGTPTPGRCSPRSKASSTSRIWSRACRSASGRDELTGITNSVIIDWRASPRGADLRPAIVIKDKKGKIGKLSRGGEARYLLPVDAILSVEPGHQVKAGDVLARIPMESAKTRDITGGLPRVAELFEARRPEGPRHHRRDLGHGAASAATTRTSGASPSCRTTTAASRSSI